MRAFEKDIDQLAASNEDLHTVYFLSEPREGEVEGRDFDIKGRINLDKVNREDLFTDNDKTHYFVCGPTQFMLDVEAKLKSYGVPSDRVKMELFGTAGAPKI